MKRTIPLILFAAIMVLSAAWVAIDCVALPLTAQPVMTPKVDGITGAAIGIDWEHSKTHSGDSFTHNFSGAVTGLGGETAVAFRTSAVGVVRIHLIVDAQADDESILTLEEALTIALDGGGGAEPRNRDRGSNDLSELIQIETAATAGVSNYEEVAAAADITHNGITVLREVIGQAGNPVTLTAGQSRGVREFILAPNTVYLISLATATGNATNHNLTLNWYETIHADFAN